MELMRIRRSLMRNSNIVLPDGYRRIAFAGSDGTAKVNLPFGFDKTDEFEIRALVENLNDDKFLVAPSQWNTNQNRFGVVGGIYNEFGVGYGNSTTRVTRFEDVRKDKNFHTWRYRAYTFSISDLEATLDVSGMTFGGTTTNLVMYYGYNAKTAGSIAYYRHKKANGALYHLIPIQNESTDEVEIFETNSRTIMTREGRLLPPT